MKTNVTTKSIATAKKILPTLFALVNAQDKNNRCKRAFTLINIIRKDEFPVYMHNFSAQRSSMILVMEKSGIIMGP